MDRRRAAAPWQALTAILATAAAALAPGRARAFDFFDGRLEIHGYAEQQIRTLADDYHPENANVAQLANVLDIEIEAALAPNGIGPFSSISGFARVLARYDCVYNGCGVFPTYRYYGDRADRVPRNLADGRRNPYNGQLLVPDAEENHTRYSHGHELLTVYQTPLLADLGKLGAPNLRQTFDPVDDALFAVKDFGSSIGNGQFTLGPWNPNARINPSGPLDVVPSPTLPLPMRPAPGPPGPSGLYPHGLFFPSEGYIRHNDQFEKKGIEQNYSETDLEWQHVQSQDERELKEAYLDVEMLDGRLYMRLGKQVIVWGKTEIFRNTDQFNPQTLALSTLPSLEESRIALWSAKAIYSFYDVGPLEDVRLELAANLDDYEPADLGRCGMPYAVWLVCGKTFGYWAHGVAGAGLAGDNRPDNWWESVKGLEFGGRLEWRWDRFSFQLSDFWGYDDFPTIDTFNVYERKVDPFTGQPLGVDGKPLRPTDSPQRILAQSPMNRQLFDVINSATVGIANAVFPQLSDRGLLDIVNSQVQVAGIPIASALTAVLSGSSAGAFVYGALTGGAGGPPLVHLNRDPGDGPPSGPFGALGLSVLLTDQQEALFGCGPFYGTSCDADGIDVLNAEASVLVQAFPQFEPGGPVATRYVPGHGLVILPGARGPADRGYDVLVDGCVGPGPTGCNAGDPGRIGPSATALVNPITHQPFRNELGAASYNFMLLLAGLGKSSGTDPGCDVNVPFTCLFVRGIFGIAGMQRPEIRAGGNGEWGRRDFVWSGGAEAQLIYPKRNVLGFAFDVDEDRTKTNWGVEATWIAGQAFAVSDEPRAWDKFDTINLAISVDRPTFINYLNPNRTFLINAQLFVRYINDYVDDDRMAVHGPLSALWTLSAFTGYHQDRLLPAITWVHDALSGSGGLIGSLTYRFTENFSATVGSAGFYGKPDKLQSAIVPLLVSNQGKSFKSNTDYDGLTAVSEKDEIYLLVRYTF